MTKSKNADSLKPNRTYFIGGHYGCTKSVKIFDITDQVTFQYGDNDFDRKSTKLGKSVVENPWLVVTRNVWYRPVFTIESPDGTKIADWRGGKSTASKNTLEFCEGSSHSSHTVTMKLHKWLKFQDSFVFNSAQYIWKAENALTRRVLTLEKMVAGKTIMVGRFWQPHMQVKQGGVLVLDAREIDDMVGVLSCLVMLRKQRQAHYEKRG